MDALRGLVVAQRLLESGELEDFIAERYSSYKEGIGQQIVEGSVGFEELSEYALTLGELTPQSGRQELLESILNKYLFES